MVETPGKKTYSPHTHTHTCTLERHTFLGSLRTTPLFILPYLTRSHESNIIGKVTLSFDWIVFFFNEINMNLGNLSHKPISHRFDMV